MKQTLFLLVAIIYFSSCGNDKQTPTQPSAANTNIEDTTVHKNFFPVTSFLKGAIANVKKGDVTPIRKIIVDGKTDSSWLKLEGIDSLFTEFTYPLIDTANLKDKFTETNFKDETLAAYTFTYDPKYGVKNDFTFKHWDVYVDAETQKVKRIYLVKYIANNTVLQLTWQAEKWAKIITLKDKTGNNDLVKIKEETITWSFD
jgi:hypothetical protein